MRKYSAKGYLIGAIFALLLSALYSMQAWPLFIKCFMSFPKLNEAVVYEGSLHIEGKAHSSKMGEVAPNFYVLDQKGIQHKVFWGLLGDELDRFFGYAKTYEGSQAKIWFHPVWGVIQEKFTTRFPDRGITIWGNSYESVKSFYDHHFNYEKYLWRSLPSLICSSSDLI